MLFNLDRQTKQNILDHYKQEALLNRMRKKEEKQKEIEEERNYLEQKQLRQKESIDLINKEKIYNRNKLKKEYNLMLQKTKGFIPRKTNIVINNWGQPKEQFVLPELRNNNSNYSNKNSFLNNYKKNDFIQLTPSQKEKQILRQIDHMDEYLTDKQNLNEIKQYFRMEKENRHNFYKDLLYSQYQNALNKNLNLYGTKDELILKQRKKKFISENPYIRQRKYDFGTSSLEHNPIINPENNYNYNKYINYKNFGTNFNKSRNLNNNNNFNRNSFDNYITNLKNINNNNFNINLNKENNNYYHNSISNILYDNNLKENNNNTISINKHILDNNPQRKNYLSIKNESPLKITSSEFNIINNASKGYTIDNDYNVYNDYNLRKNFSQGDIYT